MASIFTLVDLTPFDQLIGDYLKGKQYVIIQIKNHISLLDTTARYIWVTDDVLEVSESENEITVRTKNFVYRFRLVGDIDIKRPITGPDPSKFSPSEIDYEIPLKLLEKDKREGSDYE